MSRHIRQKNKSYVARAKEEDFEIYLQYLRRGMTPIKAARAVPMNPQRVRDKRRIDPVFRQEEMDAMEEAAEEVEQVLKDAAFGVVHYAKDADGNLIYNSDGQPVKAQRDTKAALEWLRARNAAVFNINKSLEVNVNHTVDAKELMSDISALAAQLEKRPAPALSAGDDSDILDAEVLED